MYECNSPDGSDKGIEQVLVLRGVGGPRVTPNDLKDNVIATEIVKHTTQSGKVLRWVVLITESGFAVTGSPSVSVSPENDVEAIGVQIATDNAYQELWPLMGYALSIKIHGDKNG